MTAAVTPQTDPAVERILAASARPIRLIEVTTARGAIEALVSGRALTHAGPPVTYADAAVPLRRALVGAAVAEGWADGLGEADALLAAGAIELHANHDVGAVAPMAGVIAPSFPVALVARDGATPVATNLCEGVGRALRFGAVDAAVLKRLEWVRDLLGPALSAAMPPEGLDLAPLVAAAAAAGDDLHQRNVAFTRLLGASLPELSGEALAFIGATPQFGLNLVMATAKAALDAGRDVAGSAVVVAIARNGARVGVQLAGTGSAWSTAPAPRPRGRMLAGLQDRKPSGDIGDSAITEAWGLGGFLAPSAPQALDAVGAGPELAARAHRAAALTAAAQHPLVRPPAWGDGAPPVALDARRIVETGLPPVLHTGMADAAGEAGQVGTGTVTVPVEAFAAAVDRLDAHPRVVAIARPEPLTAVLDARIPGCATVVDIHLAGGRIAAVSAAGQSPPSPGLVLEAGGRAVIPAPLDAHVHLDKAHLRDRGGAEAEDLEGAIAATSALRASFTIADVIARAERVLEGLDDRGARAARVHAEVEPEQGLLGVEAALELRRRWADRVDLQLVAFPQEGALADRRTGALLDDAMRAGCDVVGACPYADPDPEAAVEDAFARAERFDAPLDLHVDFSDDPRVHLIDRVCRDALARGMAGRVVVGHVTSLTAMTRADGDRRADALARAGVAVVALPTTDLFLSGRGQPNAPTRGMAPLLRLHGAGVTVALGTNNHANAFTPVSAPDPLRAAWLAFLVAHARAADSELLLSFVCERAGRAMGVPEPAVRSGAPADLVVLDATSPAAAVLDVPDTLARVRAGCLRPPRAPAARPAVRAA